jgi:hypothetical protein
VAARAADDVGLEPADGLLWVAAELPDVPEDPAPADPAPADPASADPAPEDPVPADSAEAASLGPEPAGFAADREVSLLFRESLL